MSQLKLTPAGIKYVADFIKEAMVNVFPEFFNYLSTEYEVPEAKIITAARFELQTEFSEPIESISGLIFSNDRAGVLESFYIVCKLNSDVPLHIAPHAIAIYNTTIFEDKPIPRVPDYTYAATANKIIYGSGELDWSTSEFYIEVSTLMLHPEHYEEN